MATPLTTPVLAAAKASARPLYPLKDATAVNSVETWVAETKRLLKLERDAEVDERLGALESTSDADLEARGLSLLSLSVIDASSGLFGRTMLVLGDWAGRLLPGHKFTIGDIVGVRGSQGTPGAVKHDITGIVSRVTEYQVTVTVDEHARDADKTEDAIDALPDRVRIDLLANDVTYQRLAQALGALEGYKFGPASRLVSMCAPQANLLCPPRDTRLMAYCVGIADCLVRRILGRCPEASSRPFAKA